jgi:hypothetical protein
LAVLGGGCACRRPAYGHPPLERCETPEGVFYYFRESVAAEEYARAWSCLAILETPSGRRRTFDRREFEAMFQAYGRVRELVAGFRLASVALAEDGERARIRVEHPGWGIRQDLRLVAQRIGKLRLWQIDLGPDDVEAMIDQARGRRDAG